MHKYIFKLKIENIRNAILRIINHSTIFNVEYLILNALLHIYIITFANFN
jgi:hypothetical protein